MSVPAIRHHPRPTGPFHGVCFLRERGGDGSVNLGVAAQERQKNDGRKRQDNRLLLKDKAQRHDRRFGLKLGIAKTNTSPRPDRLFCKGIALVR